MTSIDNQPTSPSHEAQQKTPAHADAGIARRLTVAGLTALVLLVGIGGWGALAAISGAVIAQGQVAIKGKAKQVQHPTGGVVSEIAVKNGDHVLAGDVLLRLDDTQTRAFLGVIISQLIELEARLVRHRAERDQADELVFSPHHLNTPEKRSIAQGEQRLFETNKQTITGRKAQLFERIHQFDQEVLGLGKQSEAKIREHTLVVKELDRVRKLYARRLTPITRVLAMERDETRISGESASLLASIARTKGQRAEINLQILSIDQEVRATAQSRLRDIEAQIARLKEERIAAEDQLNRVDIRAPRAGIVHDLQIHTIGGVIAAGVELMRIVPTGAHLAINIRVDPIDIDQIHIDQHAILRFSAFNQRTTPEIPGKITHIGADLSKDAVTGAIYYSAQIAADSTEDKKIQDLKLIPGMPVEAYIQTRTRSAISYLIKPVTDQFSRAFREQ
ncbi:MAG: HlyD family type I secretion periplasmic adaptor subunit [Hyphomicrobiaceae bacterium]